MNHLSPHQILSASKAVGRTLGMRKLHQDAGVGPFPGETISIPIEEMECLCRAAAPALDIAPEDFDKGVWVGPMEISFVNGEVAK
jgi:hypothetical protein